MKRFPQKPPKTKKATTLSTMSGLLSLGVRQALTKCLNNMPVIGVENTANAIAGHGLLALLILFFIGATEAFAEPQRQALNEQINLDSCRGANHRAWTFDLFEKPLTNRSCSVVELATIIPTERQPVPYTQTDKEQEKAKQLSAVSDDWLDVLKQHGGYWIAMFLAGLVSGAAFGWPPLSSDRHRKPNSRLSIKTPTKGDTL